MSSTKGVFQCVCVCDAWSVSLRGMSSAFDGSVGHAMPQLPTAQPDNPMNMYDLDQARMQAQRNPTDQRAQALYMNWMASIQRMLHMQMQAAAGAAGASSHQAPRTEYPFSMPAPPVRAAPSTLDGSIPAPTPPVSAHTLPSQIPQPQRTRAPLHYGSSERESRFTSSHHHTPTVSRAPTPSRTKEQIRRDREAARHRGKSGTARDRHRARSNDGHDSDGTYNDRLGLGTRSISAESALRKHAECLVKQEQLLHKADAMLDSLQARLAKAESITARRLQQPEAKCHAHEAALQALQQNPGTPHSHIGPPLTHALSETVEGERGPHAHGGSFGVPPIPQC